MTTEDRNSIFEEKVHFIKITMNKHRGLIRACRMEKDDIYQELSLRMINALDRYDPATCPNLDAYLMLQLRYKLWNLKVGSKRTGVTWAPRKGFFTVSLDAKDAAGYPAQAPADTGISNVLWLEHEIDALPTDQKSVLSRLLSGKRVAYNNRLLRAARQRIMERLILSGRLQYAG